MNRFANRVVHRLVRAGVVALCGLATLAQAAYPDKAVRLIVGFAPGGSDIGGRIIAAKLQEMWGQPIVVDNRPGAAV